MVVAVVVETVFQVELEDLEVAEMVVVIIMQVLTLAVQLRLQ